MMLPLKCRASRRRDGAAWRRGVEALADFPRQTLIARVTLTIAPRQIDADGIAPDMIARVGNGNVTSAAADRDHQFHLELKIGGERRIGHLRAIGHHGIARLLEEERRIAFVGFLHLANVVDIVAADAIDPANRKEAAAGDRHLGGRDRWQHALDRGAHAFDPGCTAVCPLYQSRICSPFQCTTPSNLFR